MKRRQRDQSTVRRQKTPTLFQTPSLLKRCLSDGAINCSTSQEPSSRSYSPWKKHLVKRSSLPERELHDYPAKELASHSSLEPGEIPNMRIFTVPLNEFSRTSSEHELRVCDRCSKFLEDYKRMEEIYKAKIARLKEELNFLRSSTSIKVRAQSQGVIHAGSLPNVFPPEDEAMERMHVCQEDPEAWLLISQVMRKNNDLTTLVTQLKQRVQCLAQSEAELMKKLSESIETAELAKMEKTKAEMTSQQLYLELDASRVRFEEALQDHADDQQRKLVEMLNHTDTRLESVRATLMLSEGKTAEALARSEQAKTEAEELRGKLEAAQREIGKLREAQRVSSEKTQAKVAGLKIKADTAYNDLVDYREKTELQMQLEEEHKRNLKLRISELHDRAEKAETEVVTISEANIRLLSRVTSLEKQVRELEADHQYAAQRHEEEIKELFQVARARELEMAESIEELSRLKDDKLSQAASLITQYRSMLLKLREESRTGIELFDSTLEAFGRKHKCLANMATAAQSLANKTEQEVQRLREETVDHLHQADLISKEVWRLEEAVAKKDRQITSLKREMLVLVSEIEFLRDELARHLPEDDRFVSEQMFSGNHEVTDILSRFKNMKSDWDI